MATAARSASAGGLLLAAPSSLTFGLAPFFSVSLLDAGLSPFEVLAYRWGLASLTLLVFGLGIRAGFRVPLRTLPALALACLFRAVTSLSLVFAYANIATGTASTIHFMYPLAVATAMMLFFGESGSLRTFGAILLSLAGAALLCSGDIGRADGRFITGLACAGISVLSYAAYIISVRKTQVSQLAAVPLTCYVMGSGAAAFTVLGSLLGGVRWIPFSETGLWLDVLGLALPATAVSNITLVLAIRKIGPTLSALLGALEPIGAVTIGILAFHEAFTWKTAAGILLILTAVLLVIRQDGEKKNEKTD